MPIFYQQQINENSRIGVWKIEEPESFFRKEVPLHRDVTHPHKRLQHLAGRFLLQYLFPDFPHSLIRIADTRKPYLPDASYHFSISHCGDYAAAIVSQTFRTGIDIEVPVEKIEKIRDKFLHPNERPLLNEMGGSLRELTVLWSAKEVVFKWYGEGAVDFREHICLKPSAQPQTLRCNFGKTGDELLINYRSLDPIVLAWTLSPS